MDAGLIANGWSNMPQPTQCLLLTGHLVRFQHVRVWLVTPSCVSILVMDPNMPLLR